MKKLPLILFLGALLAVTGLGGIWVGQTLLSDNVPGYRSSADMHAAFYKRLNLTDEQMERHVVIEKDFFRRKALYETRMKAANMELAMVIKEDGYASPRTEAIAHDIHAAMGELQAHSLKHLADMEKILTEEQKAILKEMVVEQLHRNATP